MRILCLNLQTLEKPYVAESFLRFSPLVQFRPPHFIFMDISSTASLFQGEDLLMEEVLTQARQFYPGSQVAIADSAPHAQVFAVAQPKPFISPPTEGRQHLHPLPLSCLLDLEGLNAWPSSRKIQYIISFFEALGLHTLGDLEPFSIESFRELWGQTGTLLWKRLYEAQKQVISPLVLQSPLQAYESYDFPISLVSFLLHSLDRHFQKLFARLQGRAEFAQRVDIYLHCEYSKDQHFIGLTPSRPNRDSSLFLKMAEQKFLNLNLENPIRQIEIEALTTPEKVQQLDFWEPQNRDEDKLQKLISVFNQASLKTGFFHLQDQIMPEESWRISPQYEPYQPQQGVISMQKPTTQKGPTFFQHKPSYSKTVSEASRPSQLLKRPQPLTPWQVNQLQFLTRHPIERLEDQWWSSSRGRDYFYALSPQGENLWVYHDRIENQYYLHGYFD